MSIDEFLVECRRTLQRLEPEEALRATEHGALLIDTRPLEQRQRDGGIPGAMVIDRNVLEWRLDPQSPHRLPEVAGYEQRVVLICNEGYSSSLAAATLTRLGLINATDVIGGFQNWVLRGLPVAPPGVQAVSSATDQRAAAG